MPMLEPYYSINQAAGVSVFIRKGGGTLDACQVQVEQKQLHLEKKIIGITGLDELPKHIDTAVPVALNLSGKGILYKQIAKVEQIGPDNFSSIFLNANLEDFYVQHCHSGNLSFVSVIRKADADEWISALIKLGFRVFMLSLGPFPVLHTQSQLNIYGEEMLFHGNKIHRDEAMNWTDFRYEEAVKALFPLKVDNEAIDERLVVGYAAAFQLVLSHKLDVIQAGVPEVEEVFEQVLSVKKFKIKGVVILIACFLALLFNMVVFCWLEDANQRLTLQVNSSARNTSDMQVTKDKIKEKEVLIRELGWDGGIRKSTLIGQIGALLPREISWREVAVNPVDLSASRNRRSLQFLSRRISVSGVCPQIIPVNEWIARIKTKPWVKGVQLESYNYNNELNTGLFMLTITY